MLKRRDLLIGAGVGLILPYAASFRSFASSGSVDVVIIGAGMAGLAAAKQVLAAGKTCAVLEARSRIGGRAYTQTKDLGIPFDEGCAWLHSGDKNPLTAMAKSFGMTVGQDNEETELYFAGKEATDAEYELLEDYLERLETKVTEYYDEYGDAPLSTVVKGDGKVERVAQAFMSSVETGADTDQMGMADQDEQIGTGVEYFTKEGLGTLVATFGKGVPVELNTKIKEIRWGGEGVEVVSDKGTIKASTCLITVSTGVLQSGAIRFIPELPSDKQQAINDLPMGLLNKVAFTFQPGTLDVDSFVTVAGIDQQDRIVDYLMKPFGIEAAVGFIGGRLAHEMEKAGEAATYDFGLNGLKEIYGNDIEKKLLKKTLTMWAKDPLAGGAYAYALPGRFKARKKLKEPIDDKLFFAGEACATKWATQLPGAYETGIEAAKSILEELS